MNSVGDTSCDHSPVRMSDKRDVAKHLPFDQIKNVRDVRLKINRTDVHRALSESDERLRAHQHVSVAQRASKPSQPPSHHEPVQRLPPSIPFRWGRKHLLINERRRHCTDMNRRDFDRRPSTKGRSPAPALTCRAVLSSGHACTTTKADYAAIRLDEARNERIMHLI
jgi:hypothetical protein